ncbi:MAG: hypothetical protein BZY80_03370 [SAR202 cluster bacterium Io17-Chloro-G2]|nr:MAG: hypothetical protein BZY80_03370 [SAR202 cluster bacterium Io17-Chloro-G2]
MVTGATNSRNVVDRFTSVGGAVTGGLSGRIVIWRASQRLALQRPWFEFEDLSLPWLRPVIGYGPDLFKYTYLLERRADPRTGRLVSERYAHNYFIHKGVELGALGLITSLGLFLVPMGAGAYLLVRHRRSYSIVHRLVLAGLLAALAGRFLEQTTGVASVSDLAITWVLFGAFAAIPAIMEEPPAVQDPGRLPAHTQRRLPAGSRPTMAIGQMWRPAVAVALIAGIGTLTWIKTIDYPLAAVKAREGLDQTRSGQLPKALESLAHAESRAPGVFVYPALRAAVYSVYADGAQGNREAECSVTGDYRTCLARKTVLHNREAAQQRPLDWRPQLALAQSTLALASLVGTTQLSSDATGLFRRVAQMDPQAWWRWEMLAAAYNQVGQPQKSLESLTASFSILGDSDEAANSFLIQGIARRDLQQPAEALAAFDRSISRFQRLKDTSKKRPPAYRSGLNNSLADAYSNRGAILNDVGRYHEAISGLDQAISLNPNLAIAYNNRANSYANLEQINHALDDYDEAIRLDPRLALAYYNRALAYTYLGDDEKARLDVGRVAELGLDAGALLESIEEAKNDR